MTTANEDSLFTPLLVEADAVPAAQAAIIAVYRSTAYSCKISAGSQADGGVTIQVLGVAPAAVAPASESLDGMGDHRISLGLT
jgi:hypothetical protein